MRVEVSAWERVKSVLHVLNIREIFWYEMKGRGLGRVDLIFSLFFV